jgi:hypothetical protein
MASDELRPLRPDGESGFNGCSTPRSRRQVIRVCVADDRETTFRWDEHSATVRASHALSSFLGSFFQPGILSLLPAPKERANPVAYVQFVLHKTRNRFGTRTQTVSSLARPAGTADGACSNGKRF